MPVSVCYAETTTSPPPTGNASTGYSPPIRVFGSPGDALQELYSLYQADHLQGALDALQRFADLYETGQIPEYHNTVNTILNWSDEILNWHHSRRSNGPLEGTNNLIQTLRRTAHGFTNPQNYAAPRTPPNMNPTTNQPDHNPTNSRRARFCVVKHHLDSGLFVAGQFCG